MSAEKVRRYGMRTPRAVSMFGTEWQISIGMQQQSEGEYVFAADYDALLSRCVELEKERDALRAALLPFLTSSGLFSPNIEEHVPPEVAHHLRALETVLRAALSANPLTSATGEK